MAFKIERVWTNVSRSNLVSRKEGADGDSLERRRRQYQQPQGEDDQSFKQASKEEVEKAVSELKQTQEFNASGVELSITENKGAVNVEFRQPNGVLIKTMTGSDFLRLRGSSDGETIVRGKILDQKF